MDEIRATYLDVLKNKYAQFDGRASRREYWTFFLVNFAVAIILSIVDGIIGFGHTGLLVNIFALATLVPSIAIMVRRLHDTDRSGWWALISLIPFGALVLLAFMFFDGTQGSNRFGSDPKSTSLV